MKQLTRYALLVLALLLTGIAISAQDVKTVTIGVLVVDSDLNATQATAIRQGVDLAIEDINNAGGVDANNSDVYRLRVSYKDVANRDDVATAIDELRSEGVIAILGPDSNALLPPLAELDVPLLLTGSGINGAYVDESNFAFQLRANDASLAQIAVEFAGNELDAEDIGLVTADAVYASAAAEAVLSALDDDDTPELVVNASHDVLDINMTAIAGDIAEENPDALLVASRYEALQNLLVALADTDWSGDVIYLYDNEMLATLTPDEDIDLYGVRLWTDLAGDQTSEDFVDRFREVYDVTPSQLSAIYHDGVQIIADVLVSAGDDAARVRTRLDTNISYSGIQGDYDASTNAGELIRQAVFVQVEDGDLNDEGRYLIERTGAVVGVTGDEE
jgi:branched-chain amino acid transport system substrate-binding protein